MKKKEEKKVLILRLPMQAVEALRKKGGIHRAKKGKGTYDRKNGKKVPTDSAKSVGFYFVFFWVIMKLFRYGAFSILIF